MRRRFIDRSRRVALEERYAVAIRHRELLRLCHEILDAYADEEEEHGFPFNFRLRAAHRALAEWMRR